MKQQHIHQELLVFTATSLSRNVEKPGRETPIIEVSLK